jgi:hypothetical protein
LEWIWLLGWHWLVVLEGLVGLLGLEESVEVVEVSGHEGDEEEKDNLDLFAVASLVTWLFLILWLIMISLVLWPEIILVFSVLVFDLMLWGLFHNSLILWVHSVVDS